MQVKEHDIFTRKDADLYCDVPIDMVTAALGGEVAIPSLDGTINLKIPAETQSGKLFRLHSKGIRTIRQSSRGDLYCKIKVETPVNLSSDHRKLFEQLQASFQKDAKRYSPNASTWVDKIKGFFTKR